MPLILARKKGETVHVYGRAAITVHSITGNTVRLSVDADPDVAVLRGELLDANRPQKEPADDIEWQSLVNDATVLFSRLRAAQSKMPEGSIQRLVTGTLANELDGWCLFVEENQEHLESD